MKTRFVGILFTSLFLSTHSHAVATDSNRYLKAMRVTQDAKWLVLAVDIKSHTEDNLHYTYDRVPVEFNTSASTQSSVVRCTFTVPDQPQTLLDPLDCGLEPGAASASRQSDGHAYYYLVHQESYPWVEIFRDATFQKTLWVNRKMEGINTEIAPVSQWIDGGEGIVLLDERLEARVDLQQNPEKGSQKMGSCRATLSANDPAQDEELIADSGARGDYIQTHCETTHCFSEKSPIFRCELDPATAMKTVRARLPACLTGWVRWRSSEGKILIRPVGDDSNECD